MMGEQAKEMISHEEFQRWLEKDASAPLTVLRKSDRVVVVKIPNTAPFDFLFGMETYGGREVSRGDKLAFCGLYHRQAHTLHLAEEPLTAIVDGLTDAECYNMFALYSEISEKVNCYVEESIENDRNRLSVKELTSESNLRKFRYFEEAAAQAEAENMIFTGTEPDARFYGRYDAGYPRENELLAYLAEPDAYIQTVAEQYMRDHQEDILLQFLEQDVLMAKYQALEQAADNPILRERAVTQAITRCGAKTVMVTIQKNGQEFTFKAAADSLLGHREYYSRFDIMTPYRQRFEALYGLSSGYTVEDIVKITYGKKDIYTAELPEQEQSGSAPAMTMGGI